MATTDRKFVFVLDISMLDEILEVLKLYNFPEAKWLEFGLKLGLLYPTLTAIEAAHGANVGRCLIECLSKWLEKADDKVSTVGPLTWQTLVCALRGIKENAVADNIHKTMVDPASQLLQHYSSRLSQVTLPVEAVQLLHTEGVISKETATEVESCGGLRAGPLRAVRTTVAEDHNKMRVLVDALLKFNQTKSLAKELFDDCDHIIPASTASTPLPSESVEQQQQQTTHTVEQFHISEVYNSQFDKMRIEFGGFCKKIITLVTKKLSNVDDFRIYLQLCFSDLEGRIEDCTSVESIMMCVCKRCTIINIAAIEGVTKHYGITEADELIKQYNIVLDKFCSDIPLKPMLDKKLSSHSSLTCEKVEFVLDWDPDKHTLNNIRRLLEKAFQYLNKRVIVRSIHEGNSIIIICYAPRYLMDSLLLEVQHNLPVLQKEMGLIRLTIGHYSVYDKTIRDKEMKSLKEELELAQKEEKKSILQQLSQKEEELLALKQTLKEKEDCIATLQAPESEVREKLQAKEKMMKAMILLTGQLRTSIAGLENCKEKVSVQLLAEKEMNEQLLKTNQGLQSELRAEAKLRRRNSGSISSDPLKKPPPGEVKLLPLFTAEKDDNSDKEVNSHRQPSQDEGTQCDEAEEKDNNVEGVNVSSALIASSESTQSIDQLKEKMETQNRISRIKTMEIEHLKDAARSKINGLEQTAKNIVAVVAGHKHFLNLHCLAEVREILRNEEYSGTSYYKLGRSLNLRDRTMMSIMNNFRGDVDRCLLECLSAWLCQGDHNSVSPSWEALIAALKDIREYTVAHSIERKKIRSCTILTNHYYTLSQSIPIEIARKLDRMNLLPGRSLIAVESTTGSLLERSNVLLKAVQDAVCDDCQKLKSFASVLMDFPATESVAYEILKDCESQFDSTD